VVLAVQHFRRPAQFIGAELGKKPIDRGAPFRRTQITSRCLLAFGADAEHMACFVEPGAKLGEAGVAHQHQEALLGEVSRLRGIEAGGAVLDRIHPVAGDGPARRKLGPVHGFRAESLHWITIDSLDFRGLDLHPGPS
jgi:hypothetical protein